VKHFIDFQYLPKGKDRPIDDGEIVGIKSDGNIVLPNVGDFVSIDNSTDQGKRADFHGRVKSRLFSYIRLSETEVHCVVNIVVEETDDDWGALIKE
jgi:hypothetical protein